MTTKLIIEIRNQLESELKKAFRNGGELSTSAMVRNFKTEYSNEIKLALEPLLEIALTKLIGDLRQRKRHRFWPEDLQTLFADLPGVRSSFRLRDAKNRKVEKILPKMTVGELEEWLHASPARSSRLEKHAAEASLLNLILPYAESMETTVEEALKNQRAGRKPKKKKSQ
jgi:hypothetical protein